MSKESEKGRFTTREWIFVFIIASLVQGAVWYISFVNAGNPSALTYVSFAGTLISIILAVLAIGYTYGESVSQKNKSDNVASQIQSLNEVIANVKIETEPLNEIANISNDLKSFHDSFKGEMKRNHDNVNEINKTLSLIKKEYRGGVLEFSNLDEQIIDKKEVLRIFIESKDSSFYIGFLMVYYASISERNSDEDSEFFVDSLDEVEAELSEDEGFKYIVIGYYQTIREILLSLKIIGLNDGLYFYEDAGVEFDEIKHKALNLGLKRSWEKSFLEVLVQGIEYKISG